MRRLKDDQAPPLNDIEYLNLVDYITGGWWDGPSWGALPGWVQFALLLGDTRSNNQRFRLFQFLLINAGPGIAAETILTRTAEPIQRQQEDGTWRIIGWRPVQTRYAKVMYHVRQMKEQAKLPLGENPFFRGRVMDLTLGRVRDYNIE